MLNIKCKSATRLNEEDAAVGFSKSKDGTLLNCQVPTLTGPMLKEMILSRRPAGCSGIYAAKWDYLEKEILSKYVGADTAPASLRRSRAIEKLLDSERSCRDINENGYGSKTPELQSILFSASLYMSDLLGDVPKDLYFKGSFSGGASTSRKMSQGHPYYKYHNKWPTDVTPAAHNRAYSLITATPLWCVSGSWDNIKLVAGNSITTVPKKSDIDRAIAKEPDLNMHLQRAVGSYMRDRLRKDGINLNQQSINQSLAKIGSLCHTLSTIDLKNASDSISNRLVWDLLPKRWYDELDAIRSHYGTISGSKPVRWEKFSAMGNGFTFELETCVFYCLLKAVRKHVNDLDIDHSDTNFPFDISVYGDDIICPLHCSEMLINVLDDVGFKTNEDKTFLVGPFRESCGEHFFNGISITPFYIRKDVDNTSRVIWLLNRLRLWSFDAGLSICDPSLEDLWFDLRRKWIPSCLLGGRNINSIAAVYSGESPRSLLLNKVTLKRIGGWRAFLANLQSLSTEVMSLDNPVYCLSFNNKHDDDYSNSRLRSCTVSGGIPIIDESEWRLVSNLEPHWLPVEYLFPKEIRLIGTHRIDVN